MVYVGFEGFSVRDLQATLVEAIMFRLDIPAMGIVQYNINRAQLLISHRYHGAALPERNFHLGRILLTFRASSWMSSTPNHYRINITRSTKIMNWQWRVDEVTPSNILGISRCEQGCFCCMGFGRLTFPRC